jgi:hypothetical protein
MGSDGNCGEDDIDGAGIGVVDRWGGVVGTLEAVDVEEVEEPETLEVEDGVAIGREDPPSAVEYSLKPGRQNR